MNKQSELVKIKEILKNNNSELYDKVIISEDLKKNDYSIVSYSYKTIDRKLYNTKFPFFKNLNNSFEKIQNGKPSFQNKSTLKDNLINEIFIRPYSNQIEIDKTDEILNFPIQENNNDIINEQDIFYIIDSVKKYHCNTCDGDGLLTCDSIPCSGKHEWECDECLGDGKTSCSKCNGEGWNTCGGWISGCGGSGKVKTTVTLASGKQSEKLVQCSKCSGKGKVKCSNCNTSGKVICSKCSGKKSLTCSKCYGDRKKYGLIDCNSCDAQGEFLEFNFVHSKLNDNNVKRIIPSGEKLLLKESELEKYFSQLEQKSILFKQINEVLINKYDDSTKAYSSLFTNELNLNKESFPKLLEEEISYKIITCIEFSYTHIISNEVHKGVIINFNESPEVQFYSNPELIKTDIKSVLKSTLSVFSKILKTKKSKLKNDRFIEIKLMIYLAKADGIIEKEEKQYISNLIQDLKDFTNSEKKTLFDLMSMSSLPELSSKDLKFSNKEIGQEIIEKLEELAIVDGEREINEVEFIDKIKSFIN